MERWGKKLKRGTESKMHQRGRCQGHSEQLYLLQLGIHKAEHRKRKVYMKLCLSEPTSKSRL